MRNYELPGRAGDVVIGLSLLLIAGGVGVFGYQLLALLRDGNWTNISLGDLFDLADIPQSVIVGPRFRSISEGLWNCPVSVALIVVGVIVPLVYGMIVDRWSEGAAKRATRRNSKAKPTELK